MTPNQRARAIADAFFTWPESRERLAETIATALRSVAEEMRAETARENAWLRRQIQWCATRLRKPEYAGTLARTMAAGPTDPDTTPVV